MHPQLLSVELLSRCVFQYSYTVCSRASGTVTAMASSIHCREHRLNSWLANSYREAKPQSDYCAAKL